jgi:hypothetical protein
MARKLAPVALALIALTMACSRERSSKAVAVPEGAPLASKPFYRIDPGPRTACASGAVCEARLALTALGDYHVNKDYPFKFVGDPAPAVPLDGQGTFALDDDKNGMMTVKFQPTAPGTVKIAGTFKLSVCSGDVCEIEAPKLALDVTVN